MINLKCVATGLCDANTYILYDADGNAVIIDPSEEGGIIYDKIVELGLTCVAVLLTHGHVDHVNGAQFYAEKGATVYIHEAEKPLLNADFSLARAFGVKYNEIDNVKFVRDGEVLQLIGEKFTVMHTPGHTVGSCCFVVGECVFSGDTIFYASVGRTDFPTGDYRQLVTSIKKLYQLGDMAVFPGHGQSTSLSYEKVNNPYVKF